MMKERRILKGHAHEISALDWHPIFENVIVSGDQRGRVCVWNLPYSTPSARIDHVNEEMLAERARIKRENQPGFFSTPEFQSRFGSGGMMGGPNVNSIFLIVNKVRFSPMGDKIATLGNDRRIKIWI